MIATYCRIENPAIVIGKERKKTTTHQRDDFPKGKMEALFFHVTDNDAARVIKKRRRTPRRKDGGKRKEKKKK